MLTLEIPLHQIQLFFLVFLRVSVILVTLPLFEARTIPPMVKAGLALSIAFMLFPVLNINGMPAIMEPIPFGLGVATEVVMGVAIGLSVRLVFTGIQLAGQLAGFQMGFAVANVIDPQTSGQVSIIAQFNYLTAAMIFLAVDAHHWFLKAMAESFTIVPPMGFHISSGLIDHITTIAAGMFSVAVKISAPVMVVLLLTSAALGLIARTVPQMNVFIVAFPAKIAVGIIFLMLTLPYLSTFLQDLFSRTGMDILTLLKTGQ